MGGNKRQTKKFFVAGVALAAMGYLFARLLSSTVTAENDSDSEAETQPRALLFLADEKKYPPFIDKELEAVHIEDETNEDGERQVIIIGVPQKELQKSGLLAIARCDATSLWHPALIKGRPVTFIDPSGDMAAVALLVGVGEQCLALGSLQEEHFTAYKGTRILALTTLSGLRDQYSDVPLGSWRTK